MGKGRRRRALIIAAVGGLMAEPSRGEPAEAVVTPREVIPGGIALVIVRDELFFSRNTVALDHGLGLYTSYLHLSGFRVFEGDIVEKRQVIGRVGATGRATGPHVHFSARLAGARVEPWQLITDNLEVEAPQSGEKDGSVAAVSPASSIGSGGAHMTSGRDRGVVL